MFKAYRDDRCHHLRPDSVPDTVSELSRGKSNKTTFAKRSSLFPPRKSEHAAERRRRRAEEDDEEAWKKWKKKKRGKKGRRGRAKNTPTVASGGGKRVGKADKARANGTRAKNDEERAKVSAREKEDGRPVGVRGLKRSE